MSAIPVMPLSYSRLSTFESCPAKFDYLYVTKRVKDKDNEFTIYGNRVHEALERYGKGETDNIAAKGESALQDVTEDITKHYPLIDKILARPGEKLFEQQMAITRQKVPCEWFAPDVWIRGIADVLVVDNEKAWCLDWKTGKPKDNPTQLQLFAALTFAYYPNVNEVRTSFIWLNHGHTTDARYKRSMVPSLWLSLEPRFDRVQDTVEAGVYKTKPSGLCPYCPARSICPDSR